MGAAPEENPDPDGEAVVVIARSTQEAIVVNLDDLVWVGPVAVGTALTGSAHLARVLSWLRQPSTEPDAAASGIKRSALIDAGSIPIGKKENSSAASGLAWCINSRGEVYDCPA